MIYVAEDLAGPKATSECAAVLTDAVPWTVTWMGMFYLISFIRLE